MPVATAKPTNKCLEVKGVHLIKWPFQGSDLNMTENAQGSSKMYAKTGSSLALLSSKRPKFPSFYMNASINSMKPSVPGLLPEKRRNKRKVSQNGVN